MFVFLTLENVESSNISLFEDYLSKSPSDSKNIYFTNEGDFLIPLFELRFILLEFEVKFILLCWRQEVYSLSLGSLSYLFVIFELSLLSSEILLGFLLSLHYFFLTPEGFFPLKVGLKILADSAIIFDKHNSD